MVIVLDASVLVKLFVDEPLSDEAQAVAARHAMILAPEIVRVEVASAITRKARNHELSAEAAAAKLADWREFAALGNVRLTPDRDVLPAAEQLSLGLRHPLADCLYLAVAERDGLPLVTADGPFVEAVAGRFPNTLHLASLPP